MCDQSRILPELLYVCKVYDRAVLLLSKDLHVFLGHLHVVCVSVFVCVSVCVRLGSAPSPVLQSGAPIPACILLYFGHTGLVHVSEAGLSVLCSCRRGA